MTPDPLNDILGLQQANSHVLAVPNGWIFYEQHKAGITSTFVPAPPPTAHRTLAEKMIQV